MPRPTDRRRNPDKWPVPVFSGANGDAKSLGSTMMLSRDVLVVAALKALMCSVHNDDDGETSSMIAHEEDGVVVVQMKALFRTHPYWPGHRYVYTRR